MRGFKTGLKTYLFRQTIIRKCHSAPQITVISLELWRCINYITYLGLLDVVFRPRPLSWNRKLRSLNFQTEGVRIHLLLLTLFMPPPNVVWLFLSCSFVRPCVRPETLLTRYLAEYLTYFHQTYTITTRYGTQTNALNFGVKTRAVPEFGSGYGQNPAFFYKSGWYPAPAKIGPDLKFCRIRKTFIK